ncbi:MAG: F0F1 ATP synthase subunit delta [Pseudomonadota bacterium]
MSSSSLTAGVAGPYAAALFELAEGQKAVEPVETDLDTVQSLLDESADLRRLVESPAFTQETQSKALTAILSKAGISGLTTQFIGVVAANRRLFSLPRMIKAYKAIAADKRGEVSAEVTSAIALSDEQRTALAAGLKEELGTDVRLTEKVDANVLGGLIVQVGSRMIDTSLRTKLNKLKYAMKEAG